jgi:hypothetical protein
MNKRGMVVVIFILLITFVFALSFDDLNENDLSGIYNNTFYNVSGFIQLNNTINGTTSSNTTNISEMTGSESGLISYWRFNETTWNGVAGEVKDVLGNNNGVFRK